MNKEVALLLLDKIKSAPYLDRVSGLVQTFEKVYEDELGRAIKKRLPVSSFASFQDCADKPQPQIDMIPNSRYKSLLYFEDQGISSPTQNRLGFDYISRIRLVCWLNTKLIAGQSNMLMSAQVINDLVGKLVGINPWNVAPFTRISVKVAGIPNQDKGIFSKYDYREEESQYLMPPFEYFAIDFNVYYTIPKDCLPPIETSLDPCSILNQIFPCTDWEQNDFPVWAIDKPNYYTINQVNELIADAESGSAVFSATAGQNLSSGRIVYMNSGKAYYYDPSDSNLAGLVLGITKTAALIDTEVLIQLSGVFEETGLGLTPDAKYFIGSNGTLTTNLIGLLVVQQAGVSIDTNKLNINFYSPFITA